MSKRIILRAALLLVVFLVPLTIYLAPSFAGWVYVVISVLAPLWLPAILLAIALPLWITFARSQYIARVPYATIELKPGPETPRSARAMELVFYALYYRTTVPRWSAIFMGHVRLPWSFEVVGQTEAVRFFVHLPVSHRVAVEARIRAEYQDIDIDESRDYSREFSFDPFTMRLAMREYILAKPDPYPLKTYPSYEEGKDKRDVFSDLLADLITATKSERIFISYIVMPHQRERQKLWKEPEDTLHTQANEEIGKIVGHEGNPHNLSANLKRVVTAIEQALQKPSFDVGIRALYIANRADFQETRLDFLEHLFDRFGDSDLNAFTAYDPRHEVGWPLSEVFTAAPILDMSYLLNLYRRRAFFNPPYYGKKFVLNTEELATVYHLPHVTSASPLAAGATRLAPPENLPV